MPTPLETLRQKVKELPSRFTSEQGRQLDPYFKAAGLENTGGNLNLLQAGKTPLTYENAKSLWTQKFGLSGNMDENINYFLDKGVSLEDFGKEIGANQVEVSAIGKGLTTSSPKQKLKLASQSSESNQSPQNQMYQNEYNRIAAQYPNDPQRALEVFKAANPGAPKDFVASLGQQGQGGQQGQNGQQGQQQGGGTQITSELPTSITSSPQWSQLSADQQALIKLYYAGSQAGTVEQKAKIDLALNEAIKIADPYIKEQINIVKDELTRNVAGIQGDFQSKSTQLQDRVKSIQEDLAYNKENLTLDQQTELSQQLRKYKGDLFNLQQSAAEAGLAFSSPRTTAEANLSAQNQDIVQSTQQRYGRALREQEVQAQRNLQALQQSAADLERGKTESLTGLQRGAEKTLGTTNTPTVEGVTPLGGVSGTIPQQQGQYVTGLTGTLLNNPLTQYLK